MYNLIFHLVVMATAVTCSHSQSIPNILIFLADDLGYGDLGCYGNTSLHTPHLDRLASSGVKLTQSLAPACSDTPSRAGFFTGRYPVRSGMVPIGNWKEPLFTACSHGLPVSELTFAEVARQAGLTTALLGKWQLGWSVDFRDPNHSHPLNHGFDYFYGLPLGLMKDFDPQRIRIRMESFPGELLELLFLFSVVFLGFILYSGGWRALFGMLLWLAVTAIILYLLMANNPGLLNSFLYRNYQIVEQPIQLTQVTRKLVREGAEFLEQRHKDKQPFLLVISWLHVHTPLAVGPAFRDHSAHGPYGDAVEELDWGVGQIVGMLDRLGLGENTLVYFTSDNGGHLEERDLQGRPAGGWNGGLKGGKWHGAPEGAIRVPTIVRWTRGGITGGISIDEPVSLMDVLPTIAHALHVQLPPDHVLDGKNILPLLRGEVDVSPHHFLFHYCDKEVHAVRYRPPHGHTTWKLMRYKPNCQPGIHHIDYTCDCALAIHLRPYLLFNLTSDPGEQRPLGEREVSEYRRVVLAIVEALVNHLINLEPVESMFNVEKLLWQPWMQPACNSPLFWCRDHKFEGLFDE